MQTPAITQVLLQLGVLFNPLSGPDGYPWGHPHFETGTFLAPHGLALDSKGDVYVGEVGVTKWKTSFPDTAMPHEAHAGRCLPKLERVSPDLPVVPAYAPGRRPQRSDVVAKSGFPESDLPLLANTKFAAGKINSPHLPIFGK